MKIVFSTLLFFLFITSYEATGGTISYTYNFKTPQIFSSDQGDIVNLENLPLSINSNRPALPFKMVRIYLPRNLEVLKVEAKRVDPFIIGKNINLKINNKLLPYSQRPPGKKEISSFLKMKFEEEYPKALSYLNVQTLHGYQVVLAHINPVFVDQNHRVFSTARIDIMVTTRQREGWDATIEKCEYYNEVVSFVDNKEEVEGFCAGLIPDDSYDYLIISSANLINYKGDNNLHHFKSFLEDIRGLKVKIVDVRNALKLKPGRDGAESIRNYIRDQYQKYNVKYVLLAADSDGANPVIPTRRLHSEIQGYLNGNWIPIKADIISDFYFGCLDGSYNEDGDGYWGEPNDGPNGKDVDFLCEVTIGRWSVDNADELKKIVEKSLQGYRLKTRSLDVLLVGELLFRELDSWGGDYMDKLVGVVNDHNFISKGYNKDWKIKRLYEKKGRWSSYQVKNLIAKNNYLMINHIGHASTGTNMKIWSWGYRGLNNKLPYFYYSQGCHSGNFASDATIIEKMIYSKGGPFGAVANSHYGLGPEDPDPSSTKTPGTSQILHRFFINRVLGENYLAFGKAHENSKRDILVYINHQEARWVTWAATFFGDPAIAP